MSDFALRPTLPAGAIPTATAIGDFNGDGHPDWVVSNGGDNSLWLYLGRGDGTSNPPTIIALTGAAPIWVTTTSLRNNGILDLIVAEVDSNTVGVLLGNGDGTFQPEVEYLVPAPPLFVLAADFNGDGNLDIVAGMLGTTSTGPVAMLPGDGHGHLGSALFTGDPVASNGVWLASADLNGDGKPDLIVVDSASVSTVHSGAQVYLNNGNGSFTPGQQIQKGNQVLVTFGAALGDVNGDGCTDAVTTDSYTVLTVFLGNCNGTFDSAPFAWFELGDIGYGVQLVDLNLDGHLDVVTTGFVLDGAGGPGLGDVGGNLMCVLLGDGTGHFAPSGVYRGEPSMFGMAVADLNGDGFPDVVTANQLTNSASVFLNDGRGGYGDPQGAMIGYTSPGVTNAPTSPFLVADLDGNGTQDLFVVEYPPPDSLTLQLTTILNDGTGKFSAPIRSPGWSELDMPWSDFALADFRNTGKPDLLVIGLNGPFILFAPNVGAGKFGNYTVTRPAGASGILAIGDFDGDGKLDFVAASDVETNGIETDQISVFLGNGDGTFRSGQTMAFGAANEVPEMAYVGDFNRDGKLDVIVIAGGLYEFFGNGDGTFQQARTLFPYFGLITVADVNKDGWLDLIAATNQAGVGSGSVPIISVFLGQPDGTFKWSETYTPYLDELWGPQIFGSDYQRLLFTLLIGDYNGDGNPDVAVFQFPQQGDLAFVQILYGNGDGTFTPSYDASYINDFYVPQLAADVNGDGLSDFITLDGYTASFNVVKSVLGSSGLQLQMLTTPVTGGTGWGRVILNLPATTATTVSFVASDPNVSVPSIVIPEGSASQDFPFTIGPNFNQSVVFSIQAQAGTATAMAYDYASNTLMPVVELDPGALIFTTNVGWTSDPQTVTLKNLGGGALPLGDAISPYFSETNDCPSSLPSGANCAFQVAAIGQEPIQIGQLSVFNTSSGVLQKVPLDGFGLGPQFYPSSLGFNTNVGSKSPPQVVTMTNYGTVSLQVSSQLYPLGQGFAETNDCSGTLAAGANCEFTVTFSPLQVGPVSDSIEISDNAPSVNQYAIGLLGNGVQPSSDYSLVLDTPLETVNAGQNAIYAFSVMSVGGFSGSVSLSCMGSIPEGTCSVSPTSLNVSSGGSTPFSVTVATQAPSSALKLEPGPGKHGDGSWSWILVWGALIPCLFRIPMRRFTKTLATIFFLVLMSACGGDNAGPTTTENNPGTPAGSYIFTVSGAADATLHSVQITLVVK